MRIIIYVLLLPGLVHLRPTLNPSPLRLIHARCYNIHHWIPGLPYLRSFSQRSLPCWAHRNRWDIIYYQRKTPDLPKSFPSLSGVHQSTNAIIHGRYCHSAWMPEKKPTHQASESSDFRPNMATINHPLLAGLASKISNISNASS